jgi:hypothetical protein
MPCLGALLYPASLKNLELPLLPQDTARPDGATTTTSPCMSLEYEMVHGALPSLGLPHRRRIRTHDGAARFEERPQPPRQSDPAEMGEWEVSALDYEHVLGRRKSAARPYVPPYQARIREDTAIVPGILAEHVCQEAALWLGEALPGEWAAELAERADVVYQHNPLFRRRLGAAGVIGRHRLRAFMRHWLFALLQSRRPDLATRLPSSYASGRDLPIAQSNQISNPIKRL